MPAEDVPMMIEYPQVNLRFVKRDGRFILQQLWVKAAVTGAIIPLANEWRDVPLVEEE